MPLIIGGALSERAAPLARETEDATLPPGADLTDTARVPKDALPSVTSTPRTRRSRWVDEPIEEPSAEVRAAHRRAARVRFRAYCMACGRSTESATATAQLARCEQCGGTMLVEPMLG